MPEKLDDKRILRQLTVYERKRQVWGWVGARTIGAPFFIRTVATELKLSDSSIHPHVISLQNLGLVERTYIPEFERGNYHNPLTRLDDPRWQQIMELVALATQALQTD